MQQFPFKTLKEKKLGTDSRLKLIKADDGSMMMLIAETENNIVNARNYVLGSTNRIATQSRLQASKDFKTWLLFFWKNKKSYCKYLKNSI